MLRRILALATLVVSASAAHAGEERKTYSWVDDDGVVHYGDAVPAEYAEKDKRELNDQGVQVGLIRGRKSAEELAEEARLARIAAAEEARRREDRALLATYLSVDEIERHRDNRVELFQAQARVTELFIQTQQVQLDKLMAEANRYQPYTEDPDAPMVDPDLMDHIAALEETILRHQDNLKRFRQGEQEIIERFDRDIKRFEELTSMTANNS